MVLVLPLRGLPTILGGGILLLDRGRKIFYNIFLGFLFWDLYE